ncbi:MAG: aminotransferase class III-fold pyridoxal phosphate-dependent enzyme [Oscillospiraceae bacterium]|jgi:glutamate-1-semialdehyde aminotransferase|nr:aminotransferase class III-fold pyridoxal phosphate-dependent enzyme [Oscillospiraceae bacterium]
MGRGQDLYIEAKKIIPGGTQLLSKRPEMWLPDIWPAYYSKAKGCEVWDLDDNHYYDMTLMGVGANVIGYAVDEVDNAAKKAIDNGGMSSLNAPEEVELAELLLDIHKWADMVRYSKTGGEAMAIATRIARAYTKKDIVLVCGYHGWHDWYLAANLTKGDALADVHLKGLEPAGVPTGLAGTNLIFSYNNYEAFEKLVLENDGNIAAVIMEPIRSDMPKDGFLEKIRKVTKENNILLIYDEITAAFRICNGGSHLKFDIIPDIAVFAKGMSNGYPLAAIIGTKDVMSATQETFISSTYWTERVALAATIASIKFFIENNVSEHLDKIGKKVQEIWVNTAKKENLDIHVGGIHPLSHFIFSYDNPLAYKTYFTQEMLKEGFLAGTGFYASYAHTFDVLDKYSIACEKVFKKIADIVNCDIDITEYLEGEVCHSGFARLN